MIGQICEEYNCAFKNTPPAAWPKLNLRSRISLCIASNLARIIASSTSCIIYVCMRHSERLGNKSASLAPDRVDIGPIKWSCRRPTISSANPPSSAQPPGEDQPQTGKPQGGLGRRCSAVRVSDPPPPLAQRAQGAWDGSQILIQRKVSNLILPRFGQDPPAAHRRPPFGAFAPFGPVSAFGLGPPGMLRTSRCYGPGQLAPWARMATERADRTVSGAAV